jgi:hypothetical protein
VASPNLPGRTVIKAAGGLAAPRAIRAGCVSVLQARGTVSPVDCPRSTMTAGVPDEY